MKKYKCNADCPDIEYGVCCHPEHCIKKLIVTSKDLQRFSNKISNILSEQTESEKSTFQQILITAKKMAIDFYDVKSNQWISLNDGTSRNVKTGEKKSNEDLLNDFLGDYLIRNE